MVKRQKWNEEEDDYLKDFLEELRTQRVEEVRWDLIAEKMARVGYAKTSKQCRER